MKPQTHQEEQEHRRAFKAEVNKEVLALCGMECDDLPDFNYVGAFNKGWSPKLTARKVVAWAKTF